MAIEVGAYCDGKVTKITAFGAFVELDGGKKGMIHISEVASTYVRDIHDHLSEGQKVRAKVVKIEEDTGRISLSLKQAEAENRRAAPPAEYESKRPESSSFEDMMSRFKATSEDKISDLNNSIKAKRGSSKRAGKPPRV